MRKIKEVLRLKYELGLGIRQIAKSCNVSHTSVRNYLERFERSDLGWPLPADCDERRLNELLFGAESTHRHTARPLPQMDYLHRELRRPGVTLALLWQEYKEIHSDGYQYSQFCEHYRQWSRKVDVILRQEHRAGEKMFADYAGQTIRIYEMAGKHTEAHLFVAVLGASNYTYAEGTLSEQLPDWIHGHIQAFEYFGGVPQIVVPDNCKTAVTKVHRYEPDLNPTYHDMARHYGTAVIPARAAKPRDKAKVETAVLIAERWILAALRHHRFHSLDELNKAIRELLEKLNHRPFQKLPGTRAEWFRDLDAPALRPLPESRYEFAEWIRARVNIDYHVEVRKHYYSVPYQLVHRRMDVRLTARTVEMLHKGRRVASHPRSHQPGKYTTVDTHRPKSHRQYLKWTPSRLIRWGGTIGPYCAQTVQRILESKPHPEQGYRSCLGLMRLAKGYEPSRMEAACRRALSLDICTYRSIKSILKTKMDSRPLEQEETSTMAVDHKNLRGREYYVHPEGIERPGQSKDRRSEAIVEHRSYAPTPKGGK
jgi:transposase